MARREGEAIQVQGDEQCIRDAPQGLVSDKWTAGQYMGNHCEVRTYGRRGQKEPGEFKPVGLTS